MEVLCAAITEKLVKNNVIPAEDFNIYKYGFEALLSTALGALLTLFIGIVSGRLLWAAVFYISFTTLRSQCGGYHASTTIKCKIIFGGIVILNLLLSGLTWDLNALFAVPMILTDYIVIIKYAPAENENKLMDGDDIKRHKLLSIILLCFWTLISIILYFILPELFWVINWSILSASVLVLYNHIHIRRKRS